MNRAEDQMIRRDGRQGGERKNMSGEENRVIREDERMSQEKARETREGQRMNQEKAREIRESRESREKALPGCAGSQEAPEGRQALLDRRSPAPRPGGQRRGRRLRRYDSMAALSALSREARRRRISYGTLCQQLKEEEREALLRAWAAEHPPRAPGGERCEGCAYWRDASATSPELGKLCHFILDHDRVRRRDRGRCLEYRRDEGEPSSGALQWRARIVSRREPSV